MKPSCLILAVTGCVLSAVSGQAASFDYENFASPSLLLFQHNAVVFQNRLRLTPAERGKRGGVWFAAKQNIQDGFQTTFQFQFTDKGGFGADGLAFVLQGSEKPRLSGGGSAMGFAHLTNTLAVKFDPYHLGKSTVPYRPYDEIAVVAGRSPVDRLSPYDSIASVTNKVLFVDQKIHTAKIVYAPGNLQVFLDDLENPIIAVTVDVATVMDLDLGRAWVGFTAATGADYYNQDVVSWSFASPDATTDCSVDSTTPVPLPKETTVPPATTSPAYVAAADSSPAKSLPADPAFGFALPGDIGLTHQIESSTDLVHWTSLTNAAFYFRDRESTNFPRRFYRFPRN